VKVAILTVVQGSQWPQGFTDSLHGDSFHPRESHTALR